MLRRHDLFLFLLLPLSLAVALSGCLGENVRTSEPRGADPPPPDSGGFSGELAGEGDHATHAIQIASGHDRLEVRVNFTHVGARSAEVQVVFHGPRGEVTNGTASASPLGGSGQAGAVAERPVGGVWSVEVRLRSGIGASYEGGWCAGTTESDLSRCGGADGNAGIVGAGRSA